MHRLLSLFALLAACAAQPATAALFSHDNDDLRSEVKAAATSGRKLAVFFSLPDCPGCREMERRVFPNPAVDGEFSRKFRTVHVDLGQSEAGLTDPSGHAVTVAGLADRLHVYATPSFVFFDGQGRVLYRHTGTLDPEGFQALGRYVSRAEYETRPFSPPKKAGPPLHAAQLDSRVPQHPDFALAATDGREYRPADFAGKVIALAVGYTSCPDICPTTLSELKAAVEALPSSSRRRVQILFATLDPERDTLGILREYAEAFRPNGGLPILGLRGSPGQTAELIRQLQLVAEKQPSASMGYTLDHTAGVFLFDADGTLRGLSPYGQPLHLLQHDLATLSATAGKALAKR